jgi:ribosomal protein S18 acetylase RimI-like enzyme
VNLSHRLETPADEEFVRGLVIASVADELQAWNWPEPMRSHLLGIQYTGRRQSLLANYGGVVSEIVLLNGDPVGWFCVQETESEIRLVEVMIAAEQRGKGIGATLIRELMARASEARKPLTLAVKVMNTRAIELYERLGFRRIGGDMVQHEMEWQPLGTVSAPAS